MSKGYVYILSNPSMPNLVKIGRSTYGGRERAKQINQTGVPSPFSLEMEILVDDHEEAEERIHESLNYYRESANREFFRIEKDEAIAAVINETSSTHVMREWESIVDEDTVAGFSWKLRKIGIDVHAFVVAASLSYLSIDAVADALENRNKAVNKRMAKIKESELKVVENG